VRDKLVLGGKPAQVGAVFAEYRLDRVYANGIDPGQVHSTHPVQCLTQGLFPSLLDGVGLVLVVRFRCLLPAALLPFHLLQHAQNLLLVIGDPLLNRVVHFQSLLQAEQVIGSPMPAQLLGNFLLALAATPIPQLG
jgi:hypothetical protein